MQRVKVIDEAIKLSLDQILALATTQQRVSALSKKSGSSLNSLSQQLGKNPSYLHQYIHRGTPRCLGERERYELARLLGVTEQLLRESKDNLWHSDHEELLGVLDADGRLAMTVSRELIDLKPTDSEPLLKLVKLQDDLMRPTARQGDTVIINHRDRYKRSDALYALESEGEVTICRLVFSGRRVDVYIDSAPKSAIWANVNIHDLKVLGRIVWIGQRCLGA